MVTGGMQGALSLSHASARLMTYDSELSASGRPPTEEERLTLPLVPASIPWTAYTICIVEFAERASYFGCTAVFSNFIQRPLPLGGNGAGAPPQGTQLNAGALGLGLQAATAITKTFSFLAFALTIVGGILADTKWGGFKTICIGTAIGIIAHVIMVVAAIPSVLSRGLAVVPFAISILILAIATSLIKPCIVPVLSDQSLVKAQYVKTLPSGQKVIVDPAVSIQNMITVYSWCINIGTFLSLPSTYAAKRVGYWLAYLIPGILFLIMSVGLVVVNRHIIKVPPQGSPLIDIFKMFNVIRLRNGFRGLLKRGESWDSARPCKLEAIGGLPAGYITWDDDLIDEVKRTFKACRLFLFMPIYLVADVGLDNILANQAASMTTNGAPNDLLQSFSALTMIVLAPLFQWFLYPWLRKLRLDPLPVRRMIAGYFISALGMIYGAVLQYRVYKTSPCGYHASTCSLTGSVSPISIWYQLPIPMLEAIASICINFTSYEIAITMAPRRLKSLVFAIVLFMAALSSALVLIVSPTFKDPNLIWPFVALAIATTVCGILNWIFFLDVDKEYQEVVSKGASN
ncbi:hypothetical protein E1B28_008718 [Marasmius oreades]|uniref:Oligopeptide transporter n=1 Tax=Marasmius oreades TaxID=181124 RepID=A0A9P7USE4_9AGAR|nr:uncharacterized protein E1B28_008718 [Marasmius oreades]KAG7092358.1 hypothetical protein E1B28_008718 [Marasmius oreades]